VTLGGLGRQGPRAPGLAAVDAAARAVWAAASRALFGAPAAGWRGSGLRGGGGGLGRRPFDRAGGAPSVRPDAAGAHLSNEMIRDMRFEPSCHGEWPAGLLVVRRRQALAGAAGWAAAAPGGPRAAAGHGAAAAAGAGIEQTTAVFTHATVNPAHTHPASIPPAAVHRRFYLSLQTCSEMMQRDDRFETADSLQLSVPF
jgi:hypothetical protein